MRRLLSILLALSIAGASRADAAPLFASPPHFLTLGDHEQIVFFLNEPVPGALAARAGETNVDVRVPGSVVDAQLEGARFHGDESGGSQPRVTSLVITASDSGGATIRITTERPVGAVEAHGAVDPPRLIIDLTAGRAAAVATPRPGEHRRPVVAAAIGRPPTDKAGSDATSAAQSSDSEADVDAEAGAPPSADSKAGPAPTVGAKKRDATPGDAGMDELSASIKAGEARLRAMVAAGGDGSAVARREPAGAAPPATATIPAPGPTVSGRANGAAAATRPRSAATPGPIASATPRRGAGAAGRVELGSAAPPPPAEDGGRPSLGDVAIGRLGAVAGAARPGRAPATRSAAATNDTAVGDDRMPCGLVWTSGVAFCAPDPAAVPYATPRALSRLASALGEAQDDDDLPPALEDATAPALYLGADRELVARARSRRLLPAIDAYRHALRRFPAFVDAPRARLNIALAYRAVGFRRELVAAAAASEADPGAALALATAGDAALDDDDLVAARDYYDRAERAGGAGACLAARGRAGLAVKANDAAAVTRAVSRFPELCPPALLADADTQRLVARERIAAGDAAGALVILSRVRGLLGRSGGALLMEDTAAATAVAGDETTARHLYEQVATGLIGAAAAGRATMALARMDAAHGNVAAALQRLDALGTTEAAAERTTLARTAIARALDRGSAADAIALVHEQRLDPSSLPAADQIRLAAAYREVGLPGEGERLLGRLRETLGADAPDELWNERGRCALARDDAPRALAIGDEWLRLHGRGDSAAAQALRARALASLGEATAARAALTAAVGALEPATARALHIDVAGRLRPHDPAAARDVLQDALAARGATPANPAETAATLRALAEAAEAAGDDAAAIAALTRLSQEFAADPSAAGAGYRLARLRAGSEGGAGAKQAYQGTAAADALEKRVVAAAQAYETIVTPFERPLPEPPAASGAAAASPRGGP